MGLGWSPYPPDRSDGAHSSAMRSQIACIMSCMLHRNRRKYQALLAQQTAKVPPVLQELRPYKHPAIQAAIDSLPKGPRTNNRDVDECDQVSGSRYLPQTHEFTRTTNIEGIQDNEKWRDVQRPIGHERRGRIQANGCQHTKDKRYLSTGRAKLWRELFPVAYKNININLTIHQIITNHLTCNMEYKCFHCLTTKPFEELYVWEERNNTNSDGPSQFVTWEHWCNNYNAELELKDEAVICKTCHGALSEDTPHTEPPQVRHNPSFNVYIVHFKSTLLI